MKNSTIIDFQYYYKIDIIKVYKIYIKFEIIGGDF